MPLVWDTSRVKYFEENKDDLWAVYSKGTPEEYKDVNAETKAMIFCTMSVGIGDLKIKNAADFYARWKILEAQEPGTYLYSIYHGGDDVESSIEYIYLSPEIVVKHIGLSTNVSTKSKKEWIENYVYQSSYNQGSAKPLDEKTISKMYTKFVKDFEEYF